jgi:protein-disulfide isomerase
MPRVCSLNRLVKLIKLLCIAVASGFVLSGCQKTNDGQRLAEVNGQPIVMADIETTAGKALYRQRDQLYNLEQEKLEEYIDNLLLRREAQGRGISVDSLVEQEVSAKIMPISDAEITALYDANKSRIPVPLDKVRDKIREFLQRQKVSAQRELFVKSLREKAKIVTYLKPPAPFREQISVDGAPFKGTEKAAVTIVKFEDFQCPFCKRVQPEFAQLLKRFDGKIKVVHRDFPIDSLHPKARLAAEAARCANEQGKFWAYHDVLYANAPKAEPEDLKTYAKTVGLDIVSFEKCLTSGKFKTAVQKDVDEGARLGITGTPDFFINGRELSGAQPLKAFTRVIDEELARAKNSQS